MNPPTPSRVGQLMPQPKGVSACCMEMLAEITALATIAKRDIEELRDLVGWHGFDKEQPQTGGG